MSDPVSDEGYWRVIIQVGWDTFSYKRQFFIKFDVIVTQILAPFPMLAMSSFEGEVLESEPPQLAPSQAMTPFITDVTSDGLIALGFPEPLETTTEDLADTKKTAVKK